MNCFRYLLLVAATCWPSGLVAVDVVQFRRDEEAQSVSGRVLVTAEDGGLLLQAADGVLWAIEPGETLARGSDEREFVPHGPDELAASLLEILPAGFRVHETAHYVICYDTSRGYATWCGGLFERLYGAFTNFWSRRGLELQRRELPLPVIIFADADEYARFAEPELGDAASSIVAYYSLRTNRVIMHDLTGVEAVRAGQGGGRLSVSNLLAQPAAEPLVATIVHEATHQIAFNCGLHTRYSDVPLWLSEGLAIFFESPDLTSSRGWRGIGSVNYRRLRVFRRNLAGRGPDRLEQLVASDRLFRDTESGPAAYADAWALVSYLLRTREADFVAYLQALAKKPRLVWDDEATRVREFREYFGADLAALDAQVREYVGRMR